MFIVLEGIDGCGKTSFAKKLKQNLETAGYKVGHSRDPDGSDYGELLREFFLNNQAENPNTDLCLMFAGRFEHIERTINNLLANNDVVICERFYYSSWAYQVVGNNASETLFYKLREMTNEIIKVGLVGYLDVDTDIIKQRLNERERDRLEEFDYLFNKVINGFKSKHTFPEYPDIFAREKAYDKFINLPNNTLEDQDASLKAMQEKIIQLLD